MLDREPFLRAIFAAPDDDVPRLVYADWLDEHGDPAWAELIRVQCELARHPRGGDHLALARHGALAARAWDLIREVYPDFDETEGRQFSVSRGFRVGAKIAVTCDDLADSDGLRRRAVSRNPEWYGAIKLKVTGGRIVTPDPLATLFTSPVTERVTELDLSGREEELPHEVEGVRVYDVEIKPVISVPMVEHLARTREVRRLTALDLRNNDLDNDALYALTKSTHFHRLKRLQLSAGNRFRGRVWAKVREHFGPDVVE